MGIGIHLGGTAVVCCVHGREKRKVGELEFDPAREALEICACCENLFRTSTEAVVCPTCDPRNKES